MGFPGGSVVKNLSANAVDMVLIPRSWGSPGEENGNPLQHSCLKISMDRGAWRATVHVVEKSQIQLNTHASICTYPHICNILCYTFPPHPLHKAPVIFEDLPQIMLPLQPFLILSVRVQLTPPLLSWDLPCRKVFYSLSTYYTPSFCTVFF